MQVERDGDPRAVVWDREAFRWVLADPRGRRVLRRILKWTQVDDIVECRDPDARAVLEGKRFIGAVLHERMLLNDPEGWVRFEAEHVEERQLIQKALEATAESSEATAEALEGAAR